MAEIEIKLGRYLKNKLEVIFEGEKVEEIIEDIKYYLKLHGNRLNNQAELNYDTATGFVIEKINKSKWLITDVFIRR